MAKKIECPNCGAPLARADVRGAVDCEYCGAALSVEAEVGASRASDTALGRLLEIAERSQLDERARATLRQSVAELQAHLASSSHESIACPPKAMFWRSGMLKVAVGGAYYTGTLLLLALTTHTMQDMEPDQMSLVMGLVAFAVIAPGFWFALRQRKLELLTWEYWPPAPRVGWLERAVVLAVEVRDVSSHLGQAFTWPRNVPQTVEEAHRLTQTQREAAIAKSATAPTVFL